MNNMKKYLFALVLPASFMLPSLATAEVLTQCDTRTQAPGEAVPDTKCMKNGAGDGFVTMGDGESKYIFSFSDQSDRDDADVMGAGQLAANFPAPTIELDEGQEFYLSLTNVGMIQRPDLFDPHTVHFHGFPNASAIYDGVPDSTISINAGATLTYFYNVTQPGTFMYHCHVEATEHMQMGMLGNLYVHPAQDGTFSGGHTTFVYNDVDGSTGYDVEYPIQIGSFDSDFHDASENTQPLPFAFMKDNYAMFNGRGYPDTAKVAPPTRPPEINGWALEADGITEQQVQPVHSLIEATAGEKVLLRFSNLNVTNHYTVAALGLTMKVVGTGAHILRGQDIGAGEADLYYDTNSVTLGGGEALDVILDTSGVAPGIYFLYTTNLNFLSNNTEDFGGMMTEIHITAAL
jgi:FtsP/CotA-like multicopper oxidase with cupredoxin domain